MNMIENLLGIKVAAGGAKALAGPLLVGGTLPVAAMLAQAGGNISESTGVAIGFVGGIICTVGTGAWFFRGMLDDMKAEVKRVETAHANEIDRLKEQIKALKVRLKIKD